MAITFAVRGNNTTAYFAAGNSVPGVVGTASVTTTAATDCIGGSYINLDQGVFGQHMLSYDGFNNLPTGQQWSFLLRAASVSTTDSNQMFSTGFPTNAFLNEARFSGSGLIPFTVLNVAGSTLDTLNITQSYVASAFYDYFWTLDTSLTTNNHIAYLNSTATGTASTGATRIGASGPGSFITLGAQNLAGQNSTRIWVNEFVIWNAIINPASVVMTTNTTAALNGSARTTFVGVSASRGDIPITTQLGLGVRRMY